MDGDSTHSTTYPLQNQLQMGSQPPITDSDFDPTLPEVRLNIAVDEMAGALSSFLTQHPPALLIPSSKAAIIVGGKRYHHFPAPIIRAKYHGPPLQA